MGCHGGGGSGAVAASPGTDLLGFVFGLGDVSVMPVVVEGGIGCLELGGDGDGGGDEGAVVLLEDGAVLELEEGAEVGVFGLSDGVFVEEVVKVFEVVGGLAEGLLAEGAGVGFGGELGVMGFEPGGVAGGHGDVLAPVGFG